MRLGTAAVAVAAVLLLAGCGGSSGVARVGGRTISKTQVDQLVARGADEARNENRAFPAAGSADYRGLEQEALGMLVEQAQVETAAQKLGVVVSDAQVRADLVGRMPEERKGTLERFFEGARGLVGLGENEPDRAVLQEDVRMQLTLRALETRLGAGRLPAWIARARRATPVSYARGWAPN
jgi:hypothetical protein